MHLLLDTNILLDVLLAREPWVDVATALWRANDEDRFVGYVVASALTDIFYIARRLTDVDKALEAVQLCMVAFEICPVDRATIERALTMQGRDFEDNIVMACAEMMGLDGIVTRNVADFAHSPVSVWSPREALAKISPG